MAGGTAPYHTHEAPTPPTMAHIQEVLTNDTIYLRDPRIAWPNRSFERRKMFQNIQNQYYRQILYGCTNPRCETPTCLSRQKRISKGPFRPYTVLSARALATHLASQDHPERGLCPYEKIPSTGAAVSPGHKELKQKKGMQGIDPSTPRSKKSNSYQASDPSNRRLSITIDKSSVRVANGQAKSQAQDRSNTNDSDGLEFKETPQGLEPVKKDPKSFTQSLFNTAAMKILQLSTYPVEYLRDLRWAKTNEEDEQESPSLEINGQDNVINGNTSKDRSHAFCKHSAQDQPFSDVDHEQTCHLAHHIHDKSGSSAASMKATLHGACRDSCHRSEDPEKILEVEQGGEKDTVLRSNPPSDSPSSGLSTTRFNPSYSAKVGTSGYSPSLSRFNAMNIRALLKKMESYGDLVQSDLYRQQMGRTEDPLLHAAGTRHDQAMQYKSFLAYSTQSITYILGNVEPLFQSFSYVEPFQKTPKLIEICGLRDMVSLFRKLNRIDRPPYHIFPSLWISAGNLYLPSIARFNVLTNRDLSSETQFSTETLPSSADQESQAHSRTLETCHIAKIILAALMAAVLRSDAIEWRAIRLLRSSGHVMPFPMSSSSPKEYDPTRNILNTVNVFEDEMALSLVTRLLRALAGRHYALKSHDDQTLQQGRCEIYQGYSGIFASVLRYIADDHPRISIAPNAATPTLQNGRLVSDFAVTEGLETMLLVLIEWLRTVIMSEWDGQPKVPKCSAIGGALEFLSEIFHSKYLPTEAETFHTYLLLERLDVMQMPTEWATSDTDRNSVHLLSYPFLFPPSVLVSYFRAINYAAMYKAYESSAEAEHIAGKMTFERDPSALGGLRLQDRLDVAQRGFLILEIRRENVLLDAMNQVWRRQRRELMRPLKVRMGMDEGEEGIDHGGVQQEFFRVAIAEALNPDYGAFTTDARSQMSWFQPFSLGPEYKYELLGLLTSLAVYNGLTLPFTFPRALYMKLLDIPVTTLEDIEDGWPQLVHGLKLLRDWPGGDVEEVFVRPYVFSFEAYGTTIDVNMTETERLHDWFDKNAQTRKSKDLFREVAALPNVAKKLNYLDQAIFSDPSQPSSSPPSDPPMVTSANRHAFISSYITHLTTTAISPSYTAFHRGFHTLLSRKSLSLFTPAHLKTLVEGHPHIPPSDLQRATTYDGGYSPSHPTIIQFWNIVHSWPQERVRKLLEFVTASDRVPVGGVERLGFVVQRNGESKAVGGRLPTSLTCFGRLLLPEYEGEGELRRALEMAVENSRGFGTP